MQILINIFKIPPRYNYLNNMMAAEEQPADYVFCYNQQQPSNLIMLDNSDKILQILLNHPQQIVFVWLLQNNYYRQINKIETQLQLQIVIYKEQDILLSHIHQKRLNKQLVIICSPTKKDIFQNISQMKGIVCYPSLEFSYIEYQKYQLYYAVKIETVKNIVKKYKNKNNNLQYRWLPNFLNLNNQVSKSNSLVRSLWAMINCQNQQITRALVIKQLQNLFRKIQNKYSSFKIHSQFLNQFVQQLKAGQMLYKRSIYWYTQQLPIYKLINNLLRSTQQPCQIFYIQPYFRNLFNSIAYLHKNQKYRRQFICYRGGKISEEQIWKFYSNVGGISQNLGFLSTSLQIQLAERYVKNVLFVINVNDQQCLNKSTLGYANISQYSQFFQESQILFNPLNFFKILQIKQNKSKNIDYFQIVLQFGGTGHHFSRQIIKSQDQKLNYMLIKKQGDEKDKIRCQGNAMVLQDQYKKGGLIYWKKMIQIVQNKIQKTQKDLSQQHNSEKNQPKLINLKQQLNQLNKLYNEALNFIGLSYQNKGFYEEALRFYCKFAQNLLIYQDQQKYLREALILNRISIIHKQLGKFDKSLELFTNSQQIITKKFGFEHYLNVFIMDQKASIYLKKQQFEKALYLHQISMTKNNYQNSKNLSGIANIYQQIGNFSKALQFF